MSEVQAELMAVRSRLFVLKIKSMLRSLRHWIFRYHPGFRDWHFWAVQVLIFRIAAAHDIIEAGGYLPHLGGLYFVPISLFFVPVVYAALNFGFVGSIATALWIVIITIPNWVFWHQGLERMGVIFQMSLLVAIAVLVGHRVDRATTARRTGRKMPALPSGPTLHT